MPGLKLIFSLFALAQMASPLAAFTITDVKYSWAIDANNNPQDLVASPTKVKSLPIFAAFTIVGTQDDINELDQNGQLPVVIDWRVNGVVRASPQVGITPVEWIRDKAALESQLQSQGFFTWRTFGFISNPIDRTISIIVRDQAGNVVAPSKARGIYEPTITLNL